MNSFTRNSPYYHVLKYLQFHLKHPVYSVCITTVHVISGSLLPRHGASPACGWRNGG